MAVRPELAWAAPSKGVSLLWPRARTSFDRLRTNGILSQALRKADDFLGCTALFRLGHSRQRRVMLHQAQQFLIGIRLAQVMVDADFLRMFAVLLRNA